MSIADSGKAVGPIAATDEGCANQVKRLLLRHVRSAKKTLTRANIILAASPGGAQGCVDAFSAGEYIELANMIDDVELFFSEHKLTGDSDITVTIPTRS